MDESPTSQKLRHQLRLHFPFCRFLQDIKKAELGSYSHLDFHMIEVRMTFVACLLPPILCEGN